LASARCEHSTAAVAALPADGVIFNNAMTSADAGALDRGAATLRAIDDARGAIACCLDGWARSHPGGQGALMLVIDLAANGQVQHVTVDQARSNVGDEQASTCAAGVVRALRYPTSPRGVSTTVEYPVRVRAETP